MGAQKPGNFIVSLLLHKIALTGQVQSKIRCSEEPLETVSLCYPHFLYATYV
jgi:hypothetical protein